ncbi:XAC2610-related protein [Flaviaesturariibacter aridisoli]|uniref:VCBS repeat-containing protein n=1 Tax=Flaviaesturariibacter aridisoli TaxID=2545761 RepID=A0A4R4DQL2_9BACT|nr:hypothetical protein [Flaviaesturariibacter aridisoli]TCZ63416.1 hypothetical protein E0486_18645 [Flaviaesturariibacter aridisoli]
MKPLRRLLFHPVLLPGIALTFFSSCSSEPKRPFGQWPVKPPAGVQPASYTGDGPTRQAHLRLAVNGDVWEGSLVYRGAEFDSLRTLHCSNEQLGAILAGESRNCFAVPLFQETDTTLDLTERWVSRDFEEGGRIITEDVNFDGHPDLVLLNAQESSLSQRSYHVWLYNAARRAYYFWDLAARAGGELLARNRHRRELLVATPDSETKVFRVTGDTTLRPVTRERGL